MIDYEDELNNKNRVIEYLSVSDEYEPYTNQNLRITIPFTYGIFDNRMQGIKPILLPIRINAEVINTTFDHDDLVYKETINEITKTIKSWDIFPKNFISLIS